MHRFSLKRVLLTILSIVSLLVPAIGPAAVAHAQAADFSLSTSSGWPGLRVEVNQVDPCPGLPSGWDYQQVDFTFTDANGVQTLSSYHASINANGTWQSGTILIIPWRDVRIVNNQPTTVTNAAAVGAATVNAQCIIGQSTGDPMDPNDDITQVAQDYTPQNFNVTRQSLELGMSATTVAPGDTVTLNSVDPCPGTEIHGSFINEHAVSKFFATTDADGNWTVNVPAASTDDMTGEVTLFPSGSYEVNAFCQTANGLATTFYGENILNVSDTPVQQPNYVAMGDSYSSGESVEPFETDTFEPGSNMCHRSTQAYARILENEASLGLDAGPNGFAACSGATTMAITSNYNGEKPQINKITADTKLITMTLGGNDMDFAGYAKQCITEDCSGADSAVAIKNIATKVIPNMNETLNKINGRLKELGNTNAQVLVVGYPQVLPKSTFNTVIAGCAWLNGGRELRAIRNVTTLLNTAIKNEANAVASNFHFVSANETDSPFAGHEICQTGNTWYFNNLVVYPFEKQIYTFHPNTLGQQAYATLIKNYIANNHLLN